MGGSCPAPDAHARHFVSQMLFVKGQMLGKIIFSRSKLNQIIIIIIILLKLEQRFIYQISLAT